MASVPLQPHVILEEFVRLLAVEVAPFGAAVGVSDHEYHQHDVVRLRVPRTSLRPDWSKTSSAVLDRFLFPNIIDRLSVQDVQLSTCSYAQVEFSLPDLHRSIDSARNLLLPYARQLAHTLYCAWPFGSKLVCARQETPAVTDCHQLIDPDSGLVVRSALYHDPVAVCRILRFDLLHGYTPAPAFALSPLAKCRKELLVTKRAELEEMRRRVVGLLAA